MTRALALDTSVAVPLLVQTHAHHVVVARWWNRRPVVLSGHAAAETYSVLTRLPGDVRMSPADAAALLSQRFGPTVLLSKETERELPVVLSRLSVAGGAVFDALVALAALENDVDLATRDARAAGTYQRVGVRVVAVS